MNIISIITTIITTTILHIQIITFTGITTIATIGIMTMI